MWTSHFWECELSLSVIAKIPFLFFFFKRLIFKIYMKLIYLGWVSEN